MPMTSPDTLTLPDGKLFTSSLSYTDADRRGTIVLLVASGLSTLAVLILLTVIVSSAFKSHGTKSPNSFVRSPAIGYFLSLFLCDVLQAVGSFMNVKWLVKMEIESGTFCTAQAVVKQTADVGIAFCTTSSIDRSKMIAFHTFHVFFSDLPARRSTMCGILISGWSATGAVVIAGPATMQPDEHGPFYGITDGRCFITDSYNLQRGLLDYMIMILSATCAFIIYIVISRRLHSASQRKSEKPSETLYLKKLGRQMLLYPVAYVLLILPITVERSITWFGHGHVSLAATTFCNTVYLLSGLVHAILFICTRPMLADRDAVPQIIISRPHFLESSVSITPSRPEFGKRERASIDDTFESYDISHVEANRDFSDITDSDAGSGSESQGEKRAWRLSTASFSSESDAPDAEVLSDESIRRRVYSPDPDHARESDYYSHSAVDAQFEIVSDFVDVHLGADVERAASTLYSLPLPSMPPLSPMHYYTSPDHGWLARTVEEQQDGSARDTRQTAGSLLDYYTGR
ncbi:hypothetical protein EWM64_g5440 [Hericium alpestre]|uniref:G-protein coupled receptors family 1 profile domain-containing protein n=1 Tax=Hericium alpestre TaxID=135208 RepID=A0A4Y9ZWM4_9AGAM|nr:hypothetical protein EWM64_g5440 [Hericium alpestre]